MATLDNPAAAGLPYGGKPRYPVADLEDDPRFCFGLVCEVGQVLESHGFPPVTHGLDHVDLTAALFEFVYRADRYRASRAPEQQSAALSEGSPS